MSNVIKFPNVEESPSNFMETDRVRIRDTIYQIPIKVKIPAIAESNDTEVARQIFVKLCEHYGFEQIDIDRDTDSDDNATACLFYINGFFLPHGFVKYISQSFKCNYDVYSTLLESMAYEYDWPIADSIEE